MGVITKEIRIGILIALFTLCGAAFLYLEYASDFDFYTTIELLRINQSYGKLLAIASIPNFFVFFLLLKKKQDERAKGVLLTVIIVTLITLVIKFL